MLSIERIKGSCQYLNQDLLIVSLLMKSDNVLLLSHFLKAKFRDSLDLRVNELIALHCIHVLGLKSLNSKYEVQ